MPRSFSDNRPFSDLERLIAWRYLASKRGGSALSVIALFSFFGVTLGVATLLIVMAVMNGFREDITARLVGISGHVFVEASNAGPFEDYHALAARIAKLDRVKAAIPTSNATVLLQSNGTYMGGFLKGMTLADLRQIDLLAATLPKDQDDNYAEGESAIIGSGLADAYGVMVGDQISALTAPEGFGRDVFAPNIKSFTIAAVIENARNDILARTIYADIRPVQRLKGTGDRADQIEIYLDDRRIDEKILSAIKTAAGEGFKVTDWQQRNRTLFSALSIERNLMFMILSLVVIVASLNIIAGLIMMVNSKQRHIAILRTMGLSKAAVLRIFMMTGSMIGIAGTISGALIGTLAIVHMDAIGTAISQMFAALGSPDVSGFFARLPAQMNMFESVLVVLFGLLIAVLAPLLPAMRAAALEPVRGINA